MPAFVRDLDAPLLALTPHDQFTLRDACAGVHVFGGIGSGKTSGSGRTLAAAYLRAGMGGLILCAKPEEVEAWERYARENGRADSLVLFDERHGFNFIDYELARHGVQGVSNVTECLMRVLEAADHATGAGGGASSDPFWSQSTRQVLNYAIPVLYAAHRNVTITGIIDFVTSAAGKPEQYGDAAWCERSYAAKSLRKAAEVPAVPIDRNGQEMLLRYWFTEYPAIPEKTRGNIVISLSAKLDRFRRGRLANAFCSATTLLPEMTFHGALIVMAMPALTWNEDGIIGQQLFKFMWQRAVESRNGLEARHRDRPVFLWADEAQYFVSVKDDEFLSTCRGSKACVVFLSQTLPSYYARLGKDKTDAADGLVGKFMTQVFHQNACNRTNTFASQLIGRGVQERRSFTQTSGSTRSEGMNTGGGQSWSQGSSGGQNWNWGSSSSSSGPGGGSYNRGSGHNRGWNSGSGSNTSWGNNVGSGSSESTSYGSSEHMDFIIEPNYFAGKLLSGGAKHGYAVTGVWFKAGGNFGGGNTLLAAFRQK